MTDFLDQLADEEVPGMPGGLDVNLHHRINNLLFGQQVLEVICLAIPYVFFHYLRALAGAASFSLTGRYPEIRDPQAGEDHASRDNPEHD